MRMQPYETKPPIEPGLLVPWMAYSPPPLSVMAAAPMGLPGLPPGITFGSEGLSRLTSAGGDHAGRIAHGLAVAEHVIERPFAGFHHHRAARISVGKSYDFACLRQLRHERSKEHRGRSGRQSS